MVITYHCTAFGAHRGRDRTLAAIEESGLWWPFMDSTVKAVIRSCWQCKVVKATPIVTGLQRSRDYDGPFRILVIDFVGPQRPITPRGNEYLFTCACGFSGWFWSIPTPKDDAETAVRGESDV